MVFSHIDEQSPFPREGVGPSREAVSQCLSEEVKIWLEVAGAGQGVDQGQFDELIRQAVIANDQSFGEEEAKRWAGEFRVSGETVSDHVQLFHQQGDDLVGMARAMFKILEPERMSVSSIEDVISEENPEKNRLLSLAAEGMPLLTSPGFVASSSRGRPPLSQTYRRMATAVDRMFYEDFIQKGLAFVLPYELVANLDLPFHLSLLSWAPKVGKAKGRPITDCSAGESALNSSYTKVANDFVWGRIQHPTIVDLVQMVVEFKQESGADWSELVLWKLDLRGAFTLLSFRSEDVPFVAAEMQGDLVIFFLCGIFGWAGTPACFQVVTRALKWEFRKHLSGRANLYVDDAFGVSLASEVESDIECAASICRRLFRSECIESSKTEIGRRVSVIGYDMDLDLLRVSLSRKNYLRVIHGLLTVDTRRSVAVREMMRFAQWASRYSKICTVLKPLVRRLHAAYGGPASYGLWYFDPGDEVRLVLRVFRALFVLFILHENYFARPFYTFVPGPADITVEFDASLSGGGILLFGEHGLLLGACSLNLENFHFGSESQFQNTAEFVVAVVGLVVAAKIGKKGDCPMSVSFRGDSVAALTWIEKESFRGSNVFNAALVLILTCFHFRVSIQGCSHVPGVVNTRADALSRGSLPEQLGLPPLQLNSSRLDKVVQLCNPNHKVLSDDLSFISFWSLVSSVIRDFIEN